MGLIWVGVCFHGACENGTTSFDSFLERIVWPPGCPGITPMPEGMQRVLHLDCSRARGRAHSQSILPASCKSSNQIQPTRRSGLLKQVHRQQQQKRGCYEQKEFKLSWIKDFIIQANLRISLDDPLLNNLIKVLGEVANCKLMRTADGTKLGSDLGSVDDRSNTGDWERLELGIEIKKMRFLQ